MANERLITETDIFSAPTFNDWVESGKISYEMATNGLNELLITLGNYKMHLSNNGVIGGTVIDGQRQIKDIYEIKILNSDNINETEKWLQPILFQLTLTKDDVTQIIGKILQVI